jgi:alcohol dehydrogenase class IV
MFFHHIIPSEPTPDMIDQVVKKYRDKKIDIVVAIGGGSVMDAGKAISAMLSVKGKVREFLEGVGMAVHPGTKLPFIAVPTTAGTGSEVTKNAVISEVGEKGFKKSLRHDNFVPDLALVDPDLTISCSPELTAASGMDCFTQLVEAYLSDKANEYTDALAIRGIHSIKDSLLPAFENGDNTKARIGMSFAALTSGICLANAGLGTVHGFASSLGALFDIPHGVVCGTLMAPANKVNVRELRRSGKDTVTLKKYIILGKIFSDSKLKKENDYIDFFIDALFGMTLKLQLPALSEYGVASADSGRIISLTENKNNPVKLSQDHLVEILLTRV